jgi:peptidoglycan/xylan/chitin deacetylase (PgdA/CDA1 family)
MAKADLSVTRWRDDKDVVFVWGIDELGNVGSVDGIDFTDWGRHFESPQSFMQQTFLPTIEGYPSVDFTIGAWLGAYDGATPAAELLDSVVSFEPGSREWEQWASDVVAPLSGHDQIELVAHGLGHEDWASLSADERHRRVKRIVELFERATGERPAGFNTWPYGAIPRDSMPELLAQHGLLVTGVLTTPQLSRKQYLKNAVRRIVQGKRYVDVRNPTKPLGRAVEQGPGFLQRVGEMGYWRGNGRRIVSVPYTGQLKRNSAAAITDRIQRLIDTADEYGAPTFYMFSHLRGTSPEQSSPAREPDGIEGQMEKFERVLTWVENRDSLWCTTLGKATSYFDMRESATVTTERDRDEITFEIDCQDCLPWPEPVNLTFELTGVSSEIDDVWTTEKGGRISTGSAERKGEAARFNCEVSPDDEPISGRIVLG